jgi:hypothetical protein
MWARIEHFRWSKSLCDMFSIIAVTVALMIPGASRADEGGVSVWLPGFFGSLAAAPLQPGWSVQSIYYHTSVSAGANVSRAREITIGQVPLNLNASLSGSIMLLPILV